ncbi:DUF885 domain-containing protein [Sphingomonas floccifaciens]|uniref:DUF885 domain-containing protein n=1 Tax=Sphingomonas floccifaciens TaxID=1844115 RepID=A0ABW4NBE8_9SPHN
MDRRALLAGGGAAAAVALAPNVATAQAGSGDAALRALLDRFFYDRLAERPEQATSLGLDTQARAGLRSQLGDESRSGSARSLARSRAEQAALRRIDRATLSDTAKIDYDVVDYQLKLAIQRGAFDYGSGNSPYVLSQLSGPYRSIPEFLDGQHRVATAADADAYLARLSAFARAIDQSVARTREDAAKGVAPPDFVLDRMAVLLAELRDKPAAETTPVKGFVAKLSAAGLSPDRGAKAEAIMASAVFPALDRQRALVTELRAKATHDAGCWRLPQGQALYAHLAEAASTVPLTGDEIHRLGLAQVAEIGARIDAILKRQGMTKGTVGERLVALNQRPDQLFPNTDAGKAALVALLDTQIAAMAKRLPEQFSYVPKAQVVARRVPPAIEAGAPGGYYQAATVDGSRPGVYFINLKDTFDRPKFGLATLSHHEAVPGHHLQVMTALESDSIPLIRRRSYFSGYGEGWALYSEQLADEMGMFDGDPLGQVGYLQSLLFRATRLVVDSGLHAKRWSREKATDYLMATTGIAQNRSQNEIDRYVVWPGQATSYKIGHTKWVELRDAAKASAGARWDPRQFHAVLSLGGMPLAVLERVVRARMG